MSAYLVGEFWIDSKGVPRLDHVSIMSEFTPKGGVFQALFMKVEAENYEKGREQMLNALRGMPEWAWVLPWVEEGKEAHDKIWEMLKELRKERAGYKETKFIIPVSEMTEEDVKDIPRLLGMSLSLLHIRTQNLLESKNIIEAVSEDMRDDIIEGLKKDQRLVATLHGNLYKMQVSKG